MRNEKKQQDIVVEIAENLKNMDVDEDRLKTLAETLCRRFADCKKTNYRISIAMVDDVRIRKINRQFLKHNFSTDCLSFDLSDENSSQKSFELIVNCEMALKESRQRGHSCEAELALYITHALLHNFGFDDSTGNQAKIMHETEDNILQQLGYGLVYNS